MSDKYAREANWIEDSVLATIEANRVKAKKLKAAARLAAFIGSGLILYGAVCVLRLAWALL